MATALFSQSAKIRPTPITFAREAPAFQARVKGQRPIALLIFSLHRFVAKLAECGFQCFLPRNLRTLALSEDS
jgi:hypothetical protein